MPISCDRHVCALRRSAEGSRLGRGHRAQNFIIVAPGERCFAHRRIGRDRGARRIRQRHARDFDSRREPRHAAELGQIADQSVGHVHRRRGMRAHGFGERIARLRQQITRRADACDALRSSFHCAPLRNCTPSAASPMRAGHKDDDRRAWRRRGAPSCPSAPRRTSRPRRHRPRRAVGVAAEQRTFVSLGVLAEAGAQTLQPVRADVGGQRERNAESRAARRPWRRGRTGSPAAPCGRRRARRPRGRNARRR